MISKKMDKAANTHQSGVIHGLEDEVCKVIRRTAVG